MNTKQIYNKLLSGDTIVYKTYSKLYFAQYNGKDLTIQGQDDGYYAPMLSYNSEELMEFADSIQNCIVE